MSPLTFTFKTILSTSKALNIRNLYQHAEFKKINIQFLQYGERMRHFSDAVPKNRDTSHECQYIFYGTGGSLIP